jgi:hypothetical protein
MAIVLHLKWAGPASKNSCVTARGKKSPWKTGGGVRVSLYWGRNPNVILIGNFAFR